MVNERQAVAQRENDALHFAIGYDDVIEPAYALGLRVTVISRIDDVPVPQGVVSHNVAARGKMVLSHGVIVGILPFVAIDEDKVEVKPQRRHESECVADSKADAAAIRRSIEPTAGEIFHLVVYLKRIELSPGRKCSGHCKS